MTTEPPTQPHPPATVTGEHQALTLLADRLTDAGLEARIDPGPTFPVLFVPIPGTRTLREMVLITGRDYAWDAGQAHCNTGDPTAATTVLTRHLNTLGDRFAPPADHGWPPTSPVTDGGQARSKRRS